MVSTDENKTLASFKCQASSTIFPLNIFWSPRPKSLGQIQSKWKWSALFPSTVTYRFYTNLAIWMWCDYNWVWFSNWYLEKKPHAFEMLWLK